jgi:hypothetical protein
MSYRRDCGKFEFRNTIGTVSVRRYRSNGCELVTAKNQNSCFEDCSLFELM